MELKETTRKIFDILGIESSADFTGRIYDLVMSGNCHGVFDAYLELLPDLSVDWLQRIYQFYCADREMKKQDYTPVSLSRMVAMLTATQDVRTVYDCCCGSGSLTIQQWRLHPDAHFVCEELDKNVIPLVLFNLAIRNASATVIRKNILTGEVLDSWEVSKGNRYSSVMRPMFPTLEGDIADISVSNSPFNLKEPVLDGDLKGVQGASCNFSFVERCILRTKDKAAIILPQGALTNEKESPCRQSLVERGLLEAVITLPEKMFESTDVAVCILLLDKAAFHEDVMLVDASSLAGTEKREQRGEGTPSHYNRVYTRTFRTFSDSQILAVCELINTEQRNVSMRVSREALAANNYNLSPGKYKEIDTVPNTMHRDFNEVIRDINRVIRERNILRISVNTVWAKELGLSNLIEQCKQSAAIARELNGSLKFKNYEVTEMIYTTCYTLIGE